MEDFHCFRHFHEKLVQIDAMNWSNSMLAQAIAKEQIAIQSAISKGQMVEEENFGNLANFLRETSSMDFQNEEPNEFNEFVEKEEKCQKEKSKNEEAKIGEFLLGKGMSNSPKPALPLPFSANNSLAAPSTSAQFKEIQENPKLVEKLGRCKIKFIWMMTDKEEERERARQVLSREKYAEYVQRLRRMDALNGHVNYRESRVSNRFMLDETRKMLLDRRSRKPFLCYEEMFDSIHRCYLRPRFGGLRAVYAELKRNYANITMECVNVYLKACGYDLKTRYSVQISKWMEEL